MSINLTLKGKNEEDAMDKREFQRWRRTLGYTQEEAAGKFGVVRGTIVHWESGDSRIPHAIELACCELTRRSRQEPGYGPVKLVYAEEESSRKPRLQCELYSNNASALEKALKLNVNVTNPMIMDDTGGVVWTAWELLRECERLRDELRPTGRSTKARAGPRTEQTAPATTKPR